MQCPLCETPKLAIAERQGIEIDYCPECRGVWLDRGELDKIIERSTPEAGTPEVEHPRESASQSGDRGHKGKHKRKSMLSELFDF